MEHATASTMLMELSTRRAHYTALSQAGGSACRLNSFFYLIKIYYETFIYTTGNTWLQNQTRNCFAGDRLTDTPQPTHHCLAYAEGEEHEEEHDGEEV